ncbi:excinuclease ABC subunit UvrC [Parapedomonas caeni]
MNDPTLPDRFSEEQAIHAIQGADTPDLERGVQVIRDTVKTLPARPGVYRMVDASGSVLYVGKARSLKARVVSYTQVGRLPVRLQRMVAQTRSMVVVTTHTEAEALLLEANLIKHYRTPFNVLLRDDKSFPFIVLREGHAFAQIGKHRGARKADGHYYGPFASATAVNRTLNTLEKVFLLRSCSDSYFQNRSRPCLLHQIKRCSAPCADRITPEAYQALVREAKAFLSGRSQDVHKRLREQMQAASDALEFEKAAALRDRLRALSVIQSEQGIQTDADTDADIVAAAQKGGVTCIQIFFIRGGQNWGNRALYPRHDKAESLEDVLFAFLSQFYEDKPPPRRILLDRALPETDLLAEALSTRAERKVAIDVPQRGKLKTLVELAARNASEALDRRLAESASQARHLALLAELFGLDEPPGRIEVYDNSHIQGTNAVGGMIVAGPEGFRKNAYRKFNFKSGELTPGDDFAMMREMLTRRFARLQEEDPDRAKGDWPDLVLIDGGKGQLTAALAVLAELGIEDVTLVGVAKGPDRNAGREVFHLPDGREFTLEPNNPALFFMQRLRDEAHRFAIGSHRQKRSRDMAKSPLDDIPGVGPARKKALLMHFGTARAVTRAGIADLAKVDGVSDAMARAIYEHFHPIG